MPAPAGNVIPPDLDTKRVAGLYAAFTGSRWANQSDLDAAAAIERRSPGTRNRMLRARRFHSVAAVRACENELRGVVFAAPGYPGGPVPDPHEEAHARFPDARFVYADASPEVADIYQARFGGPRVAALEGSLRRPRELWERPEVQAIGEPLCLLAQWAMHFWPADVAQALLHDYGKMLGRGSVLVVTWALPKARSHEGLWNEAAGTRTYRHPPETVTSWLRDAGFGLLGPECRDVRHPSGNIWPALEMLRGPGRILACVARKA